MNTNVNGTLLAGFAALLLGVAACASYPAPNAQVASSQAAIRAAEESGAKTVPQAALHLKLAQEQLQSAKALMNNDENERAEYVLQRAQADAELAIALSHTQESREEAGKALRDVNTIRSGQTPAAQ